jgi:hypothetical protein
LTISSSPVSAVAAVIKPTQKTADAAIFGNLGRLGEGRVRFEKPYPKRR